MKALRSPSPDPTTTSRAWVEACGLDVRGFRNWWVEIRIDVEASPDSYLELRVYPREWGFTFRHGNKASDIRIADATCALGRDDHGILDEVTDLSCVGELFRTLERRYALVFRRHCCDVRSNVRDAPVVVRRWLGVV